MPVTVSTSCQSRFKDCCAPSTETDTTLVSNGEEPVQVFTAEGTMIPAGISAPTVAATMTDGGTGILPAGNVAYLYVYASSGFPKVSADTTAGGNLWPKGQPSPVSANYTITANHKVNVTVATTKAPSIDKILIYRTIISPGSTPPSYTSIVATAGQVFYVGFINNNPAVSTVTFTDNVAATQEEMEVDNFPAPQFWLCCYIDPYWYGIGNPDLVVPVTIDSGGGLTATYNAFYSGRVGQFVTFDGITMGGFDGNGTFYYKYLSSTVANVSVSADYSTTDFPGYVGTTTMRVRGYAGTLYRSKARNPFAWGYTEYQTPGDSQIRVTQQFAQPIGGYGEALAVMPQQRLLKIDTERPSRCYSIDVSVPLESNFLQATRLLDSRYIVTAHHSQFLSLLGNGQTGLRGFDTSNFAIVQSDSGGQAPISDPVQDTLRKAVTSGDTARQFHGVYDSQTELSAFWFKTAIDPANLIAIDACLLYHGPSGQWSFLRDLDVTASASVYDPVTLQNITLIGTANGQICQAFAPGVFSNILTLGAGESVSAIPDFTVYTITPATIDGTIYGTYFDIPKDPSSTDRFWFQNPSSPASPGPPPAPASGRLTAVSVTSASLLMRVIQLAMQPLGYATVLVPATSLTVTALQPGALPPYSLGTTIAVAISATTPSPVLTTSQFKIYPSTIPFSFVWAYLYDANGQNEKMARLTYVNPDFTGNTIVSADLWFDPATGITSSYPGSDLSLGLACRIGLINCEAQTYFQPSETVSGTRLEMWSTRQNMDTANQWARFYQEFDTVIYGSPFQLIEDKRQGNGAPSMNWYSMTGMPTTLVAQFGVRMIERGFGDFTMMSFTLKGK